MYNARVWPAAMTLCRRTLEGIVIHLIAPEDPAGRTLAQSLHDLPKSVDLTMPLTSLAHSVRLGGNVGPHFDMKVEPDEELARAMLDLVEYMLEYFFTIPKLVDQATLL